ncbi:MAG: polysaccharide deacetylase family protein [Armatimonadota bacterium]
MGSRHRCSHCALALTAAMVLGALLLVHGRGHSAGWRHGVIYRVAVREKLAALSFDDGPHPEFTPAILDVLDKHNVRATFFMVGSLVELYPEIAREVAERGHAIGNHTYTHPTSLELLPAWAISREIEKGAEAIERVTGQSPLLFRPPRGQLGPNAAAVLKTLRYKVVMWSVSADHHDASTPHEMAARVLARICPGMIVLLHDGSTPARWRDVVAAEIVIEALQQRGYKLVTVPELLQSSSAESADHLPNARGRARRKREMSPRANETQAGRIASG